MTDPNCPPDSNGPPNSNSPSDLNSPSDPNRARSTRPLEFCTRRDVIAGLAGATAVGALGLPATSTAAADPPGSGWSLAFEDDFDGGSLDTDVWDYGWGWGDNADYTPATSDASGVWVDDGVLKQEVWRDGGQHYVGNVNSKGGVEFSPPVYFEARIRCLDLPGANNAFWAKPASEAWPPEIDVMEIHRETASEAIDHSIHNLHYSTHGGTGGGSGTVNNATNTLAAGDYQDEFHTFGVLWETDAIAHYLDGERIGRSTHSTMLSSMQSGAPFYVMLSMQTIGANDWLGYPPDESWDDYDTVMETDWVRVWKPDGDGSSGGGGAGPGDDYLWARPGEDGSEISFAFEVSGDVSLQDTDASVDYWVDEERSVAGGVTAQRDGGLPGFWYTGEITDLRYEGPFELYVNDEAAEPDAYADPDSPGPYRDPQQEQFLWVRSDDGDEVSFAFEATGDVSVQDLDADADFWVDAERGVAGGTTARTDGGLPGFWVTGEVTDFRYDGAVELYVDDEPADPDDLADPDSPGPYRSHVLEIARAPDSSGAVHYVVETDGDVRDGTDAGAGGVDDHDEVGDASAMGVVSGGTDPYRLVDASRVSVATWGGDVTTTLDGEAVDLTGWQSL